MGLVYAVCEGDIITSMLEFLGTRVGSVILFTMADARLEDQICEFGTGLLF